MKSRARSQGRPLSSLPSPPREKATGLGASVLAPSHLAPVSCCFIVKIKRSRQKIKMKKRFTHGGSRGTRSLPSRPAGKGAEAPRGKEGQSLEQTQWVPHQPLPPRLIKPLPADAYPPP